MCINLAHYHHWKLSLSMKKEKSIYNMTLFSAGFHSVHSLLRNGVEVHIKWKAFLLSEDTCPGSVQNSPSFVREWLGDPKGEWMAKYSFANVRGYLDGVSLKKKKSQYFLGKCKLSGAVLHSPLNKKSKERRELEWHFLHLRSKCKHHHMQKSSRKTC